jgi:hypothetical protein
MRRLTRRAGVGLAGCVLVLVLTSCAEGAQAATAQARAQAGEALYAQTAATLRLDEFPLRTLVGQAAPEDGFAGEASPVYVDGVSDQSPPAWSDPPGEAGQEALGADGVGAHVTMAR